MHMYSVTEQMVAWLLAHGYYAYTRPPREAPHSPTHFVTVERTGGYVVDMVDHPTVAVQTWAPTEDEAESMANEIRLLALTEAPPIGVYSMGINAGPYAFFDEDTRCPRYQIVFDITSQLTD